MAPPSPSTPVITLVAAPTIDQFLDVSEVLLEPRRMGLVKRCVCVRCCRTQHGVLCEATTSHTPVTCSVVLAIWSPGSKSKIRVCACESEREADWKWGELLKKLGLGAGTTLRVDCGEGGAQCVTDANSLWSFLDSYGTFKGPLLLATFA
jgi:hypothetical protein